MPAPTEQYARRSLDNAGARHSRTQKAQAQTAIWAGAAYSIGRAAAPAPGVAAVSVDVPSKRRPVSRSFEDELRVPKAVARVAGVLLTVAGERASVLRANGEPGGLAVASRGH